MLGPALWLLSGADSIDPMASITIRRLDESTKKRLRMRAASHGRSMEEEARNVLRSAPAAQSSGPTSLVESIRRRLKAMGWVNLPDVRREPMRQPPSVRKVIMVKGNVNRFRPCPGEP
jgi:antitoxin FitA